MKWKFIDQVHVLRFAQAAAKLFSNTLERVEQCVNVVNQTVFVLRHATAEPSSDNATQNLQPGICHLPIFRLLAWPIFVAFCGTAESANMPA